MKTTVSKLIFCVLIVVACMFAGILSAYAMDAEEKNKFIIWLNGSGELSRTVSSLAASVFRIENNFYDVLTREQVKEIQKEKDKFMRKIVSITADKYASYTQKRTDKERKKEIKFKGIGVYIGVPQVIQEERAKQYKEQIINAVSGLGLTLEDFDSKGLLIKEFIMSIADRLETIDPDFKKFRENYKKGFLDGSGVEILGVFVGGPAEKAGVKKGWIVTHIDGVNSDGLFMQSFIDLISKSKKKSVVLTLTPPANESEKQPKVITIKKGIVNQTWLTNEIRQTDFGQIGIIKFNHFDFSRLAGKLGVKKFEDALIANKESVGVVIRLEDNGGGLLVEADLVLDRLLPNGRTEVIIDERGKKRKPVSTSAQIKRLWGDKPVVFRTNGHSASASELVAGSMREQLPNLVKLVGEPTFGKGSIQSAHRYPDGTELKITTGRFKMPLSEKTFEGEPLQPDVLVKDDESTPEDEVLEKAIEVLRKLVLAKKLREAVTKETMSEKALEAKISDK